MVSRSPQCARILFVHLPGRLYRIAAGVRTSTQATHPEGVAERGGDLGPVAGLPPTSFTPRLHFPEEPRVQRSETRCRDSSRTYVARTTQAEIISQSWTDSWL